MKCTFNSFDEYLKRTFALNRLLTTSKRTHGYTIISIIKPVAFHFVSLVLNISPYFTIIFSSLPFVSTLFYVNVKFCLNERNSVEALFCSSTSYSNWTISRLWYRLVVNFFFPSYGSTRPKQIYQNKKKTRAGCCSVCRFQIKLISFLFNLSKKSLVYRRYSWERYTNSLFISISISSSYEL